MTATTLHAPGPVARERVLLVDDEESIVELVRIWLEGAGYEVHTAGDGDAALTALQRETYDIVVLDVMMPERSGLDVLRYVRDRGDTGVILLTAKGTEQDRVLGLSLGADDYIVKPFSLAELVERVRAVLRRVSVTVAGHAVEPLEFGSLRIDLEGREAFVDGASVELTAKEFDLLVHLASSPGKVFSRSQLLRSVWESSPQWQTEATVTEHVHRLRGKLGGDRIATVRGAGYRFERRFPA